MAIKVLHAYRTYFPDPPGGVQELSAKLLCYKAKGIENTIYTLSPNPRPVVLKRPEGVVYRSKSWVAPVSCDIGGVHAYKLFRQLARAADLLFYQFPCLLSIRLMCMAAWTGLRSYFSTLILFGSVIWGGLCSPNVANAAVC